MFADAAALLPVYVVRFHGGGEEIRIGLMKGYLAFERGILDYSGSKKKLCFYSVVFPAHSLVIRTSVQPTT